MDLKIQIVKYNKITASAHNLFWKFGIRKVSIEEICKDAGVSKMTFYKQFENKAQLAQEILERLYNDGLNKYRAVMQENISFPEKVKQIVLMKHEFTNNISEEFIRDAFQNEEFGLVPIMQKYQKIMQDEVVADFVNAQKEGWIRKEIKPEFMIYMLNVLTEKAFEGQLSTMFASQQDMIMELTNFYFYGVMSHENQTDK